jgi:hypothetical protein
MQRWFSSPEAVRQVQPARRTVIAILYVNEVLMPFKNLQNNNLQLIRHNIALVKKLYPNINRTRIQALKELTKQFSFSFASGDVIQLENGWFVTHIGLIRLARRKRCRGILVEAVNALCDSAANRFVLKATVYPSKDSAGFVGYGDAHPCNVSLLVRGAEMRMAETRAVNRALRKAYGIGICSLEEIGSNPAPIAAADDAQKFPPKSVSTSANGSGNGSGHKVRDRLCQIIRQHKLDPELVKAYAVDFCGTKALKDASREQVEGFVQQLAEAAMKDRGALLCQLNSYARPSQEVAG